MGFFDFMVVLVYGISIAIFYKKGYRTGITHGLDKILDEMDK